MIWRSEEESVAFMFLLLMLFAGAKILLLMRPSNGSIPLRMKRL
jgi:hypothetical protein